MVQGPPAVNGPTLLIYGCHDIFTAPSQADRIAPHLPDVTTAVLDDTGHFPWVDQPERFFGTIDRWTQTRPGLLDADRAVDRAVPEDSL